MDQESKPPEGDERTARTSFDELAAAVLTRGGLMEQAEARLKHAVEIDPDNLAAIQKLATIYRCRGDVAAALNAYRRISELRPDDVRAQYLQCVLSGRDRFPTALPPGDWPAPFVRIEGFLSQAERDLVLALALKQQTEFEVATIGEVGEYKPETRTAWVVSREIEKLIPWFLPRVETTLANVLPRLQVSPFRIGQIELQMTVHRTGSHYKIHPDKGAEKHRHRRVSYVYYFHRVPKRFTGGDLLLYDSDTAACSYTTAFTRLGPLDNSIVFFPSEYFHQVTVVECETEAFGDGRFTLNGWFHAERLEDTRST